MEYLRKNPQSEFVSSAGGVNYVWLFKVENNEDFILNYEFPPLGGGAGNATKYFIFRIY